mgnify:FL=1
MSFFVDNSHSDKPPSYANYIIPQKKQDNTRQKENILLLIEKVNSAKKGKPGWCLFNIYSDESFASSRFLGYEKNSKGEIVIVPSEASVVRRIYRMFLKGYTQGAIAESLTKDVIPTPCGKTKWQFAVVDSILRNEKYKGCALLQKTFSTDYLSKTYKKNEGEISQYYIE